LVTPVSVVTILTLVVMVSSDTLVTIVTELSHADRRTDGRTDRHDQLYMSSFRALRTKNA
jgi:hypothetical protein